MWTIDARAVGSGRWDDGINQLNVDGRGGDAAISFQGWGGSPVRLRAIPGDRLPAAGEHFVRGNQWHINYPQEESSYALRLSIKPVESRGGRLTIELCVSIQTDLLDLHPTLDIEVDCDDVQTVVPDTSQCVPAVCDGATEPTAASPITVARHGGDSIAVLLGPHDHPFTSNRRTGDKLQLRLFGDFLEKGVIRRARPWLVLSQSKINDPSEVKDAWQQLDTSPLPLT